MRRVLTMCACLAVFTGCNDDDEARPSELKVYELLAYSRARVTLILERFSAVSQSQ